jgi:hypothetical protein
MTCTLMGLVAGARFAITGGQAGAAVAEQLVRAIGARPVEVAEADRIRYHATLAHACNHVVTPVVQAMRLLRRPAWRTLTQYSVQPGNAPMSCCFGAPDPHGLRRAQVAGAVVSIQWLNAA